MDLIKSSPEPLKQLPVIIEKNNEMKKLIEEKESLEWMDSLIMPPKIIKLSQLIHEYEGNKPWHRAVRNKNPGNCRYYPKGYLLKYGVVTKDKDGFAVFSSMDIGWLYLQNMLLNWAKTTKADWTILRMMKMYAPESDGNSPELYAQYLTKYLGIPASSKMKDLLV